MEIYSRIMDEFAAILHVKEWQEMQALFHRVASNRPSHWLLPVKVCEAVGGDRENVIPAVLAVACSHIGIILVDDMLDEDPRGEHTKIGEGTAANMASALQSAALTAITNSKLGSEAKLLAMESVNEMFLATTIGQHWDVNSIVTDEDLYWKIASAKSSPFFGAAFQIGAVAGGATVELSLQIKELGRLYGEMIQLHDDVNDTLAVPASPDWDEGRSPLTILFAQLVDHPLRHRFKEIRSQVRSNSQALEEAQDILIHSGAVSYCLYQLLKRYDFVKGILATLKLEKPDVLEDIFDHVVRPVFSLFQEVDDPMIAAALQGNRE